MCFVDGPVDIFTARKEVTDTADPSCSRGASIHRHLDLRKKEF